MDWAENVLSSFSYGEAFLEMNETVLKRYAACTTEEEIKATQEAWLAKIEKEYKENREGREGESEQDAWSGGNLNRRQLIDSEDEGDSDDGGENANSDASNEQDEAHDELPVLPEYSDDEEEMAELRRKVLQSRPFVDADNDAKAKPISQPAPSALTNPSQPAEDSDALSGSDLDNNDDFDNIINATPVTDRTGIIAKERARKLDNVSASFSRTIVNAPGKW